MIGLLWQVRHHRVVRFVLVGFANAALHFGILNTAFYLFDQSKIVSSILATVCAVVFSFVLNRNFVFSDKSTRPTKQLLLFVTVTLVGMLLIHNLVYAAAIMLINNHEQAFINIIKTVFGIMLTKDFVSINSSTIIGALFAMVWNYNGYRLFVFKDTRLYEEDPDKS